MSSYKPQTNIYFSEFYKTSYITELCWIVTEINVIKVIEVHERENKYNIMWRKIYVHENTDVGE
jgi:hypothetical protein